MRQIFTRLFVPSIERTEPPRQWQDKDQRLRWSSTCWAGLALSLSTIITLTNVWLASNAHTDPALNVKSKIAPRSPVAARLGRYGVYPVTVNNGLVNISMPLYEIKSGKINVPISLSYCAGGVKGYDVSSGVGLGWTLNADGTITWSIIGGS